MSIYGKVFIQESKKDNLSDAREFVSKVLDLAKSMNLNCFVVTDGASGTRNNGNEAVENARKAHINWERKKGYDPFEDWSNQDKK